MAFKVVGLPEQPPVQAQASPQASTQMQPASSAPRFKVVGLPQVAGSGAGADSIGSSLDGLSKTQLMEAYRTMPRDDPRREQVKQKLISDSAVPDMNKAQSFAAGVTDTMSMGLSDEVQAGMSAMTGGDYDAELNAQRNMMKKAAADNPMTNTIGMVAGALPGMLMSGGTSGAGSVGARAGISALNGTVSTAKGAGIGARMGAGALENAAQMGVYGFGSGEGGFGERATNAAIMGTAGAVLGSAFPLAGAAFGAAGRGISTASRPLTNVINRGGGAEKLVADSLRRDMDAAAAGGREMLEPADITASGARGEVPIVGDLGDDATGRLARAASNVSPEAKMAMQNATEDRFLNQSTRVTEHLDQMYGGLNSKDVVDAISRSADQNVRPLYERAMNDPRGQSLYTNDLQDMMQSPAMQQAIGEAEARSANAAVGAGTRPVKNPFGKDASGVFTLNNAATGATPSLAFWDVVKRGLDDQVNKLYRAGEKDAARDIRGVRDRLRGHLDDLVPTYKQARGMAADHFKANDAFDAGQKFASQTKEGDVSKAMSFLAGMRRDPRRAAELELFERGFMSSYSGKLASTRDGRDLSKLLFGSKLERDKLSAAVDPSRRTEIESLAKVERIMQRLREQVKGGSNTTQQMRDISAYGLGGFGLGWATGNDPFSAGGLLAGGKFAHKAASERMMRQVGEILASNDPAMISKLITKAGKDPATRSALAEMAAAPAVLAPDLAMHSLDSAASGASDEVPGYKRGGAVTALVNAAKKASSSPKQKLEGEALIDDWQWRPEKDVADELGLQDQPIPDHVQAFGHYMKDMSDKAGGKGLSKRDMIKAFAITRSSIQRGAVKADKLRAGGFDIPNAGDKVRPEGAMAEWFFTPSGQRYLNRAEKGVVDEEAIKDFQAKFKPFGKADKDVPDFMRGAVTTFDDDYVKQLSDLVARGSRGESTPDEWRAATERLRGIGPAKKGFIASLLGRGDQPTPDARQLVLQTGKPSKGASKFMSRRGGRGGDAAVERLAQRQRNLNMQLPSELDPYYQHLTHHTIWDKTAGEKTTHSDIIRAMKLAAQAGAIPAGVAAQHIKALEDEQGGVQAFADGGQPKARGGKGAAARAALNIIRVSMPEILDRFGMPSSGKAGEKAAQKIASGLGLSDTKVSPLQWSYQYQDRGDVQRPEGFFDFDKAVQDKAVMLPLVGDTTPAGRQLLEVNDVPLLGGGVRQTGGADYIYSAGGRRKDDPRIWASMPSAAKKLSNWAKGAPTDGPVYGMHSSMGSDSGDFSHMTMDTLKKFVRSGDITPEAAEILAARTKARMAKKSRISFEGLDDAGFWDDIVNTDNGRGVFRSRMLGEADMGAVRSAGFPDMGPLRFANTDQNFLMTDSGTVGRATARLDGNYYTQSHDPLGHGTYTGEVGGVPDLPLDFDLPSQLMFQDHFIKRFGIPRDQLADVSLSSPAKGSLRMSKIYQKATPEWRDTILRYRDEVMSGKRKKRNPYRP